MSKLLESLLIHKERIVPLLGLNGVGKSALARNTMHYAAERKIFSGGVLFIQLKYLRSNFAVIKYIMNIAMKLVDLSVE